MERKNERLPVFTERFRELQGEQSNTEFSEFLGISRQSVGFYLNGDRVPDAITLIKIAEKCDVSSDWLLGLSDIKAREGEIKQVCNYTGLSALSVNNLHIEKVLNRGFPGIETYSIRLINEIAENQKGIFDALAWKAGLSALNELKWKSPGRPYSDVIASMVADSFAERKERDIGMVKIPVEDAALFYRCHTAEYVEIIAGEILDEYIEDFVKNTAGLKFSETTEN